MCEKVEEELQFGRLSFVSGLGSNEQHFIFNGQTSSK